MQIYVPLHGVHTEMLRTVFEQNAIEVKAVNLQSKNYIFQLKPTFRPINPDGCNVVASKTKKNILITIAVSVGLLPEPSTTHSIICIL